MVLLLVLAGILTYLFRSVLATGVLFTHFFYIPIILACIWWRRQGLVVTTILVLVLLISRHLDGGSPPGSDDYLRVMMLLAVSAITVALSDKLAAVRTALKDSEKRYRTIFENTGTATLIIENEMIISLVNREFENLSGFSRAEVEGLKFYSEFVAPAEQGRIATYHHQRREPGRDAPGTYEFDFINREGEIRQIFATIDVIPGTKKSVISLADITAFKNIEKEQRVLRRRLSDALEKALSGFIPICANCKKIRDKNGDWIQVESYIKGRTQADFSHSICPDCKAVLYPDL